MARRSQHAIEAVDFGVGVGRLTGHDQARWHGWVAGPQALGHGDRGVVRVAHGEENFEIGVVLFEECAEVFFQAVIHSGERLEDADGCAIAQGRRAHAAVTHGGDDGEDAVDQRARDQSGKQGWQKPGEHFYTVTSP